MHWLVILMMAILTVSNVTGINMGFAPGVNVKNVFMYALLTGMMLRFAVTRDFKLELPGVQLCFVVLIFYTIMTFLVGAFIIEYPRFPVLQTAMQLVRIMVDPILFFTVVFYGLRSAEQARTVLRAFLIICTIANALTITDVMGITSFGVEIGAGGAEENRVFGFFGHAVETGSLIVFILPLVVAFAFTSRGAARLGWFFAAAISAIVFILNGSRGPLVGMLLGGMWGVFICRRHLPLRKLAIGAAVTVPLLLLIMPLVAGNLGLVLIERIAADLSTSNNIGGLSSGRTDLWSVALGQMASLPFTMVTGFGYGSWRSMSFEYDNPHSHYLFLWFELGIVGVLCFALMIWQMVRKAGVVADYADPATRYLMIGFTVGILSLSVSVATCLLIGPWNYIYAIMGAVMRIAVSSMPMVELAAAPEAPGAKNVSAPGRFGWRAASVAGVRKIQ
jgi:O-antigen ligase